MQESPNAERPTGITALGVLALISGVFGIITSCVWLYNSGFLSIWKTTGTANFALIATGVADLIEAVIQVGFALGALQLRSWAWTLGVVLEIANLLTAAVNLYEGVNIVSQLIVLAISIPILLYLNTWLVRRAFGRI